MHDFGVRAFMLILACTFKFLHMCRMMIAPINITPFFRLFYSVHHKNHGCIVITLEYSGEHKRERKKSSKIQMLYRIHHSTCSTFLFFMYAKVDAVEL